MTEEGARNDRRGREVLIARIEGTKRDDQIRK